MELRRDPIRLTLALLGCLFLMITLSYGITVDVENLSFAVLDRDQTILSRNYVLNLAGAKDILLSMHPSRIIRIWITVCIPGEISLAIEIPPHFARDVCAERPVSLGSWIDGAMPRRAETIKGYVNGAHHLWLNTLANQGIVVTKPDLITIENRFRYNPDVKSIPAIVPAVIPLLLLFIPAILSSLSVVRERELGSIINLYVTPVTKLEFLIGKLVPYISIALINYLLMVGLAFFSSRCLLRVVLLPFQLERYCMPFVLPLLVFSSPLLQKVKLLLSLSPPFSLFFQLSNFQG